MRQFAALLTLLYPRRWRKRYRDEFHALLEDAPLGPSDLLDITKGALTMRMQSPAGLPLWKVVAVFTLFGGIAAGIGAAFMPRIYRSSAILTVRPETAPGDFMQAALMKALSSEALGRVIRDHRLYESAASMDARVDRLKQSLRIGARVPFPPLTAFSVSFDDTDPATAQRVTRTVVALIKQASAAEVVDPPTLPRRPLSPHVSWMMFLGCLAGLLIGVFSRLFLRRPHSQPAV
jgi:uncharacterized protein involved in exopolysaccharide biosynthesis